MRSCVSTSQDLDCAGTPRSGGGDAGYTLQEVRGPRGIPMQVRTRSRHAPRSSHTSHDMNALTKLHEHGSARADTLSVEGATAPAVVQLAQLWRGTRGTRVANNRDAADPHTAEDGHKGVGTADSDAHADSTLSQPPQLQSQLQTHLYDRGVSINSDSACEDSPSAAPPPPLPPSTRPGISYSWRPPRPPLCSDGAAGPWHIDSPPQSSVSAVLSPCSNPPHPSTAQPVSGHGSSAPGFALLPMPPTGPHAAAAAPPASPTAAAVTVPATALAAPAGRLQELRTLRQTLASLLDSLQAEKDLASGAAGVPRN